MAIHRKTVELAFDTIRASVATVTDATGAPTYTSFGAADTLHLPETTSRTIQSAWLELYLMDNSATAITITGMRTGLSFAAAAFVDQTEYSPSIANTGDHQGISWLQDVTAAMVANYGAGASQTIECHICVETSAGASAVANVSAKLCVTYDADYAAQDTQAMTIALPLQSPIADLTTTLAQIGTNQVLQLTGTGGLFDGILATVSIKQLWFDLAYNEANSGTTDAQLGVQLDAATEVLDAAHEHALDSGRWVRSYWRQDAMDPTAAHAFNARTTQATMDVNNIQIVLYLTITFSATSSAGDFHSLRLVGEPAIYGLGGSTNADPTVRRIPLLIPEASPVLKRSAVLWSWMESNRAATFNCKVGAQTVYEGYTGSTSSVETGMNGVMHRIDSGGAGGAAITLVQGVNTFDCMAFSQLGGNVLFAGVTPTIFLNYSCAKPAAGGIAGNRTVSQYVARVAAGGARVSLGTVAVLTEPVETEYYVSNAGVVAHIVANGLNGAAIEVRRVTGEDPLAWMPLTIYGWVTDAELSILRLPAMLSQRLFKRWKGDPDPNRISLYAARPVAFVALAGTGPVVAGLLGIQTYSAITFTCYVADPDVTGANGDPVGTTYTLHDATTGEPLRTMTANAGGDASVAWFDNRSVFVQAQQDATHAARSFNFVAGS